MTQDDEPLDPEEVVAETWSKRVRDFFESLGSLLATRVEIFKLELGSKGGALGRAAIAFFLAAAFAMLALLLLTAGLAALLSYFFGTVLGIAATFVLFAGAAALAAYLGVKALARGNLLEFPLTSEEIKKDWKLVTRSSAAEPPAPDGSGGERVLAGGGPAASDDLEARFRVGSE